MDLIYWNRFLSAFTSQLKSLSAEDFQRAWMSSANRTILYENVVLPNVAHELGLEFVFEEWKVDYTLCRKVDEYLVPEVFVESENVAVSAHHEVRKLCCLASPLKVLIVCSEWSNEDGDWRHGGHKEKLLLEWSSIIQRHSKVWPQNSIFGVIVAEANELLTYYAVAFDNRGKYATEHNVIHSINIS